MTPRRWRQLGTAGLLLAIISVGLALFTCWRGITTIGTIHEKPLIIDGKFPTIERFGFWMIATHGNAQVRWVWWDSQPDQRWTCYTFDLEGVHDYRDDFGIDWEQVHFPIWGLTVVGAMVWGLSKLRASKQPEGFPVHSTSTEVDEEASNVL